MWYEDGSYNYIVIRKSPLNSGWITSCHFMLVQVCVSCVSVERKRLNAWGEVWRSVMCQADRFGVVNRSSRDDKKCSSSDINSTQTWGWQLHWYPVEGLSTVLPPDSFLSSVPHPPPLPLIVQLSNDHDSQSKALSSALFTPEHLGRKKAAKPAVMGWKYVEGNEKRKALDSTSGLRFFLFFFFNRCTLNFQEERWKVQLNRRWMPLKRWRLKKGGSVGNGIIHWERRLTSM